MSTTPRKIQLVAVTAIGAAVIGAFSRVVGLDQAATLALAGAGLGLLIGFGTPYAFPLQPLRRRKTSRRNEPVRTLRPTHWRYVADQTSQPHWSEIVAPENKPAARATVAERLVPFSLDVSQEREGQDGIIAQPLGWTRRAEPAQA